ncbi:anti-sigma factor antagonist [Picosynechococcus sp. PCC 7002]|nr:anti-sigma factor antagonist [Picosynechococcus sp. PCC 7002]
MVLSRIKCLAAFSGFFQPKKLFDFCIKVVTKTMGKQGSSPGESLPMDKNQQPVILRPNCALTTSNLDVFWRSLHGAINDEFSREILVDLQQVEFIDSAAAVVLSQGTKLAESHGKRLGCCGINSQVRMVLELTQMEQFVRIFKDEAAFLTQTSQLLAA